MSFGVAKYGLPAERRRGLCFCEEARDIADCVRNGGTPAGAPIPGDLGIYFDGTDDAIGYNLSSRVIYSFTFTGILYSASEEIFQIATGVDVSIAAGSIVATGFTAPTYYVNGAATAVCPTGTRVQVTVVTGTAIAGGTAYLARVGAAFGNILNRSVKLWNAQLTAQEVADFYNNRVF